MKATNQAIAGGKGSVKCEGCMKMAWSLAVIAAASVGLPSVARHCRLCKASSGGLPWRSISAMAAADQAMKCEAATGRCA